MWTLTDLIVILSSILIAFILAFAINYFETRKAKKENQAEALENKKRIEQVQKLRNEEKEKEAALRYWKQYVNS
jgi:uncharacterized protein YpmB